MDIKEYIDNKLVPLCELREQLQDSMMSYFDSGLDHADTVEVGQVADAIKDLAEAEESVAKAMYHKQIVIAMDKSEYGKDYDENGAYYSTPMSGRRMPHMKMYVDPPDPYFRDMDRHTGGRMYFTEHDSMGKMDARMGKSGTSRMKYFESKDKHNSGSKSDMDANLNVLEEHMNDVSHDLRELVANATSEERTMVRTKLMNIANAVV